MKRLPLYITAFAVLLVTGILIMPANLAAQRTLPPDISIPDDELPDKAYYGEDNSKLRVRIMYLFEVSTRMRNYVRDYPDSGIADEVLFLYGQKLEYMGKLDKAKEVYKECKEKYPDRVFWKFPYLWRGGIMEGEAQVAQLYLKYIT